MYYHAVLELQRGFQEIRLDRTREELIHEIVVPYVRGQIITGVEGVVNLSTVSRVMLYRSEKKYDYRYPWWVKLLEQRDWWVRRHSEDCTHELIETARAEAKEHLGPSLLQMTLQEPKKQVFVAMKFNDKVLDSAYQGVIKPLVEEFDYDCLRIDEVQDSGQITDQILEAIACSELILCDLSGERPNCYYEAGFAHALGRTLILTVRAGEPIHFDLAGRRFIQWETEHELRQQLSQRLRAHIKDEKS